MPDHRVSNPPAAPLACLLGVCLLTLGCGEEVVTVGGDGGGSNAAPANAPAAGGGSFLDRVTNAVSPVRVPAAAGRGSESGDAARDAVFRGQKRAKQLAATVRVTLARDVPGADRYLQHQLREAVKVLHEEQTAGSRARTEANRKRAEERVKAEMKREVQQNPAANGPLWASGTFGGRWYRYERAEPEVDGVQVYSSNSEPAGGPRAFRVYPVPDLDRLAGLLPDLRKVSVDPADRVLTLAADLPDPLPDENLDDVNRLYPAARRVRLVIDYPTQHGEFWTRRDWLREVAGAPAMSAGGDERLTVARHQWLSEDGRLVLTVGPVDDVPAYADRVDFGDVRDVDATGRTIAILGRVPDNLEELAEAQEQRDKAERDRAAGISDREPREGETHAAWAARVLRENTDTWATRAALDHLKVSDPAAEDPDERAAADAALLAALRVADWHEVDDYADAVIVRKPDGYLDALAEALRGDRGTHHRKEEILEKLAGVDDPGVGFIAAGMLGDHWLTEPAVAALRRLGPNAEPALLPLLSDPRPEMRRDVAALLSEVGTERGAEAILARSKLEDDRQLARHMRIAAASLRKRLEAGDGEGP